MWKQEITARMMIQLLFKQKQKQKLEENSKYYICYQKWKLVCTKIENIFIYYFPWLHNYWGMVILLGIFAIIWHPGIGYRPKPPENKVVPSERKSLHSPISFQIQSYSLQIFRKNHLLAEYPICVDLPSTEKNFAVSRIEKCKKGWAVYLSNPNNQIEVFLGSQVPPSQQYFITMDEDYWEVIYPYLRIGVIFTLR